MFLKQTAAVLLVLGLAPAAQASDPAQVESRRDPTSQCCPGGPLSRTAAPNGQESVDVSRLPLDLRRIQRELSVTVREERDGLNLRYVIEVYGQGPPLVVFRKEDNLVTGPVPYGAPTHKEFIEHVTPKEYRAPAADISALIRWLSERSKK